MYHPAGARYRARSPRLAAPPRPVSTVVPHCSANRHSCAAAGGRAAAGTCTTTCCATPAAACGVTPTPTPAEPCVRRWSCAACARPLPQPRHAVLSESCGAPRKKCVREKPPCVLYGEPRMESTGGARTEYGLATHGHGRAHCGLELRADSSGCAFSPVSQAASSACPAQKTFRILDHFDWDRYVMSGMAQEGPQVPRACHAAKTVSPCAYACSRCRSSPALVQPRAGRSRARAPVYSTRDSPYETK